MQLRLGGRQLPFKFMAMRTYFVFMSPVGNKFIISLIGEVLFLIFLGLRGSLVLPRTILPSCPEPKILISYIKACVPFKSLETPQTSPLTPWDPLDAPLAPLGPIRRPY